MPNRHKTQIERYDNKADELHLYRLEFKSKGKSDSLDSFSYDYVKSRTFHCGSKWCDFDAGGGVYFSPSDNLYMYSTDFQQAESTERFRMVEFGRAS